MNNAKRHKDVAALEENLYPDTTTWIPAKGVTEFAFNSQNGQSIADRKSVV